MRNCMRVAVTYLGPFFLLKIRLSAEFLFDGLASRQAHRV